MRAGQSRTFVSHLSTKKSYVQGNTIMHIHTMLSVVFDDTIILSPASETQKKWKYICTRKCPCMAVVGLLHTWLRWENNCIFWLKHPPPGFASYHVARSRDRQADSDDPQGDWRRSMPPPSGSTDEGSENDCDSRKKSSSRSRTQRRRRRSKEHDKITSTGKLGEDQK